MFNAIVRLCIRDLLPCMLKMLNLNKQGNKDDSSNNRMKLASQGANWKKLKAPIKSYLDDVLIVIYRLTFLISKP